MPCKNIDFSTEVVEAVIYTPWFHTPNLKNRVVVNTKVQYLVRLKITYKKPQFKCWRREFIMENGNCRCTGQHKCIIDESSPKQVNLRKITLPFSHFVQPVSNDRHQTVQPRNESSPQTNMYPLPVPKTTKTSKIRRLELVQSSRPHFLSSCHMSFSLHDFRLRFLRPKLRNLQKLAKLYQIPKPGKI